METTIEDCLKAMDGLDFAEVRIDAMNVAVEDMRRIFSRPLTLIATFMPLNPGMKSQKMVDPDTRKRYLIAAIESGAKYVDVEILADDHFRGEIIERAKTKNCKVIVSFHDFHATPDAEELESITALCFQKGADIAKIACKVNNERDNLRLLRLLDNTDFQGKTIVIGMGEKGKITRIAARSLAARLLLPRFRRGKKPRKDRLKKIRWSR
jgi:3-dehydroquinate dehydratase-1